MPKSCVLASRPPSLASNPATLPGEPLTVAVQQVREGQIVVLATVVVRRGRLVVAAVRRATLRLAVVAGRLAGARVVVRSMVAAV
jgi:hypothetical protein